MEGTETLKKLPFWEILTEKQKKVISDKTSTISYKKGTLIYSNDMSCLGVIYILRGRLRVVAISEEGREVTLFHISRGEHCVFSAACALSQITMETEMITEEDTELLTVAPIVYSRVMQENLDLKCQTYELVIKRMSKVASVMSTMLFERMDTRLARFLLTESENSGLDEIHKTQEAIASELNTAREVVARTLKRLSNEGTIAIKRGRIIIVDKERLKKKSDGI